MEGVLARPLHSFTNIRSDALIFFFNTTILIILKGVGDN